MTNERPENVWAATLPNGLRVRVLCKPDFQRSYAVFATCYGVIVCRCEEISRGEILDALRSNVCVPTVDGVKKRVRPGMGRCQGGFCSPQVVRIIAEYLGVPLSAVRKSSADAPITFGPTKSGEVQA